MFNTVRKNKRLNETTKRLLIIILSPIGETNFQNY